MTPAPRPARTFADFTAHWGPVQRIRTRLRDAAVGALSVTRSMRQRSGSIRFLYYHHVFDDEREGFVDQLVFLRRHGEFIGIDDAVGIIESGTPVDGRYFCLGFDDGFKCCAQNAAPILAERGVPAAFFLPTRYIGTSPARDRDLLLAFYPEARVLVEFLDWDDCRRMAAAGMTFGSHTVHHARLSELTAHEAERELAESKAVIERELGAPCRHFCVPFGTPGSDFRPERDPALARGAGYRSFLTGRRGSMAPGSDPYAIRRDCLLALWGTEQLRYFLAD